MNTDEMIQKAIAHHDERRDFVTDVDGYLYFWPQGSNGHFAAWHLRAIADELDRRNAPWDAIVKSDPAIGGSPVAAAPIAETKSAAPRTPLFAQVKGLPPFWLRNEWDPEELRRFRRLRGIS